MVVRCRLALPLAVDAADDNSPMRSGLVGVVIGLCLVLWGCSSGPQVRSLVAADGITAYELSGRDSAELDVQARRLCTKGYEVLRRSASFGSQQDSDGQAVAWLQPAAEWISGVPPNQAQATIVCRA